MADFDDALNNILSNPAAMAQIAQLAQSFSGTSPGANGPPPGTSGPQSAFSGPPPVPPPGSQGTPHGPPPESAVPPPPLFSPAAPGGGGTPFSPASSGQNGGGTPDTLLSLVRALGGQGDSHARALLYALRPYLKPHRQEKIERALQLARLYRLGRLALSHWGGIGDV